MANLERAPGGEKKKDGIIKNLGKLLLYGAGIVLAGGVIGDFLHHNIPDVPKPK